MKKHILILMILGFIISCTNSELKIPSCPKSYFTEVFPKRPIDLSKRLGDSVIIAIATPSELIADTLNGELIIKQDYQIDTAYIGILFDRKSKNSTIIDLKNRDTIFYGYVSKYREFYYLTEKKTDSTYWIGALNIDFDSIQGLGMIREQMCDLENFAENNLQNSIILKNDTLTGNFEFCADKRLIREIYPNLIKKCPKIKIISDQFDYENNDWEYIEFKIPKDPEIKQVKAEIIETIFPNPIEKDFQIEFCEFGDYKLELINTNCAVVYTKKISGINTLISVGELQRGFYILRVYSIKNKLMETERIILR